MRFDANGVELKQLTVWVTVDLYRLIRADKINVNRFVNDQFEAFYGPPPSSPPPDREQLAETARESIARQRMFAAEREENLERARTNVQAMRARRDAATARHRSVLEALVQIAGDVPVGRLSRMLPENDMNGDRLDDWDALVRRVSRLCGAEIDSAEVAEEVRALIAAKP